MEELLLHPLQSTQTTDDFKDNHLTLAGNMTSRIHMFMSKQYHAYHIQSQYSSLYLCYFHPHKWVEIFRKSDIFSPKNGGKMSEIRDFLGWKYAENCRKSPEYGNRKSGTARIRKTVVRRKTGTHDQGQGPQPSGVRRRGALGFTNFLHWSKVLHSGLYVTSNWFLRWEYQ